MSLQAGDRCAALHPATALGHPLAVWTRQAQGTPLGTYIVQRVPHASIGEAALLPCVLRPKSRSLSHWGVFSLLPPHHH